jgi:hypothetical protein
VPTLCNEGSNTELDGEMSVYQGIRALEPRSARAVFPCGLAKA